MKLSLKWQPENNKCNLVIDTKNTSKKISIEEDFSNVFGDNFVKLIIEACDDQEEEFLNNEVIVNEVDFPDEYKSKISVLKSILNEFVTGLNS